MESKKPFGINLTKKGGDINNSDDTIKILRRRMEEPTQQNDKDGEIQEVDLSALQDNPHQPRRSYDDESITELAMSIKSEGLLQPITITKDPSLGYIVVYGHRRVRACQRLGYKTIRAIYINYKPEKLRTKALIENIQRDDMYPMDIAISFELALEHRSFASQSDLANAIGKDRSYVSKILKLLSMPEKVKNDLLVNKSVSDRAILDMIRRIENPTDCEAVYFWCAAQKPTRKEVQNKISLLQQKGRAQTGTSFSYLISKSKDGLNIKFENIDEEKMKEIKEKIAQLLNDIPS